MSDDPSDLFSRWSQRKSQARTARSKRANIDGQGDDRTGTGTGTGRGTGTGTGKRIGNGDAVQEQRQDHGAKAPVYKAPVYKPGRMITDPLPTVTAPTAPALSPSVSQAVPLPPLGAPLDKVGFVASETPPDLLPDPLGNQAQDELAPAGQDATAQEKGAQELEQADQAQHPDETAKSDFSDVDFEALDAQSDYTRFMGKDVPDHIREKALAKLWTTNPLFGEMDGLDDYAEDFTDAAMVVANIRTDYKVGRGFMSDEDVAQWDELGAESKQRHEEEQRAMQMQARGEAGDGDLVVALESPDQPEIAEFFAASEAYHTALYPVASNHFMPVSSLMQPDVRFVVARRAGKALGCGALVLLDGGRGEIKRMWAAPDARGQGVGYKILSQLQDAAVQEQVETLYLETGDSQAAAFKLYRRNGFAQCEAFGDYQADPRSIFMEKKLTPD